MGHLFNMAFVSSVNPPKRSFHLWLERRLPLHRTVMNNSFSYSKPLVRNCPHWAELSPRVNFHLTCNTVTGIVFVNPCFVMLTNTARMGMSKFWEKLSEISIIFHMLLSILTKIKQFHVFIGPVREVVLMGNRHLVLNVYAHFSEAVRKLGDFGSY